MATSKGKWKHRIADAIAALRGEPCLECGSVRHEVIAENERNCASWKSISDGPGFDMSKFEIDDTLPPGEVRFFNLSDIRVPEKQVYGSQG